MTHRMVSSALTAAFPFDGLQVDVARAYAFSMAAFYLSHISYGEKKNNPQKDTSTNSHSIKVLG